MPAKKKQAVIKEAPSLKKKPRIMGQPTLGDKHVVWRFSGADQAGPWGWGTAWPDSIGEIVRKLKEFETLNYLSIVSLDRIVPEAFKRLRDINKDDTESLHGWHIKGKQRLWCIEHEGTMCVLWWDPEHQVYPTPKKYT
jgi:hypothetical protein